MKISKKVRLALRNMLLKTSRVATDKGELIFDEEELAVGVEVFVENTEGEETELVPAADGEYAEGNRVIVVSEGKVSEIRVSEEPEQPEATEIEVPAEDPIEEPEAEPETTVEERVAALEARLAEVLEGINEILSAISALNGRIDELDGRIKVLEGEPAEEPIDETPEEEVRTSKLSYLKRN